MSTFLTQDDLSNYYTKSQVNDLLEEYAPAVLITTGSLHMEYHEGNYTGSSSGSVTLDKNCKYVILKDSRTTITVYSNSIEVSASFNMIKTYITFNGTTIRGRTGNYKNGNSFTISYEGYA